MEAKTTSTPPPAGPETKPDKNKNLPAKVVDNSPIGIIKSYCYDPNTKGRIEEMLGRRSGAFIDSIISCVKSNRALQECEPSTVMSAALQAAAVNLPIDPILGYAAIVPYNTKHAITVRGQRYTKVAQFQRMYKGIIQHCLRSNQYKKMRAIEVYNDELASFNPITGDVQFTDPKTWRLRYLAPEGEDSRGVINPKDIAGVYFYFRLVSGFECENFMPKAIAMAHGRRYSKAFAADIKHNTTLSLWSTNPVVMMIKTNIIATLSKYGVMSIELQDILADAQQDFNDAALSANRTIAGNMGTQPIDTQFEGQQNIETTGPATEGEQIKPEDDFLSDEGLK